MSVCVIVHVLEVAVGVRTVSYPKSEKTHWRFLNGTVS